MKYHFHCGGHHLTLLDHHFFRRACQEKWYLVHWLSIRTYTLKKSSCFISVPKRYKDNMKIMETGLAMCLIPYDREEST
jgi:hypothetical protein